MNQNILLDYLARLPNNSVQGLANHGATDQIQRAAEYILAVRTIQLLLPL